MTTIAVDFNDLVRGGQVLGYRDAADGAVAIGDEVTAVDADEDMSFQATVVAIEGEKIYLEMRWRQDSSGTARFSSRGNRIHRDKKNPAGVLLR